MIENKFSPTFHIKPIQTKEWGQADFWLVIW